MGNTTHVELNFRAKCSSGSSPNTLSSIATPKGLTCKTGCDSGHGATRGVMLKQRGRGSGVSKSLITNDHMSCGSRSPPKRKRSFPILAVMPTQRVAGAPGKQAMIPWRGTGALSRRRSPAGRARAHPCSTPYSVEQSDRDLRPRRVVGSTTARARGVAVGPPGCVERRNKRH